MLSIFFVPTFFCLIEEIFGDVLKLFVLGTYCPLRRCHFFFRVRRRQCSTMKSAGTVCWRFLGRRVFPIVELYSMEMFMRCSGVRSQVILSDIDTHAGWCYSVDADFDCAGPLSCSGRRTN